MNLINCEKKEKSTASLNVEVTFEEFNSAKDTAYKKNRGQISVPGFRRGKAPRKIIERMYGADVFTQDALEALYAGLVSFSTKEADLRVVGYPTISDVDEKEGGSVVVTLEVSTYPEVTVGEYKGISAVKPLAEVSDSEIAAEIENVRSRNARIEAVTRPAANGDTTVIDFEGFLDGVPFDGGAGEDYELVLGSNSFIPGFEEKLVGMEIGDERDIDLTFPEDYHQKDLAGKAVIFKVKLKELKEKILPELDDEFAKDVSEFDTLDEYKNSIREKKQKEKDAESDAAFENAVVAKIVEGIDVTLPDAMIEGHVDTQYRNFVAQISQYGMEPNSYFKMMNTDAAGFRANMRPSAENSLKQSLALEKIAELEGVQPDDEEVENHYKEIAEQYGSEVEDVKKRIERTDIERELKLRAALKIVTEAAVKEAPPAEDAVKDAEKSDAKETAEKTPAKRARKPKAVPEKTAETTAEAEVSEKPAAKKPAAKRTAKKVSKETDSDSSEADK